MPGGAAAWEIVFETEDVEHLGANLVAGRSQGGTPAESSGITSSALR